MKWVLLLFLFLCGCRTEYVPIESVRYDSVMIEKLMRDSVFVRDSVYLKEKGDTVYKYKDKYVYLFKNRIDTFFGYRDKEIEIPVPVERKLTWWERQKMDFGGWVILMAAVYVVFRLVRWVVKRTRKRMRVDDDSLVD